MSDLNCNISFLLKDELEHELKVHKITYNPTCTVIQLRKLLRKTFKLARRGSLKFSPLDCPSDIEKEVSDLTEKGNALVASFADKNLEPSARSRLIGRANYLLSRISRIPEPLEELLNLQSKIVNCLSDTTGSSDSSSESEEDNENSHCHNQTVIYKPEKSYNLNSLNLKFKGDTCVRAFLTRLEELYVARKIPKEYVFTGFPDLIDGPALHWYRANKHKFTNYDQLVAALRSDFDIPDYDYRLLQEIHSRTQAKDETLVIFLSVILGMMSRLSRTLTEEEKLDIVLRNIRPEYSRELALVDIKTISELQTLGKKLELCKARIANFSEPTFSKNSIASDFDYKSKSTASYTKPTLNERSSSVNTTERDTKNMSNSETSKPSSALLCFRCGKNNHTTSRCTASREVMCFKCGLRNVKTPDCPKCSKPSKN